MRTCSDVASEQVGEFNDRTVRELGVVFAGNDRRVLASQHQPLVLPLKQQQNVVEQYDVQIDLLGATDAPGQRTFVQHPVLGDVEVLHAAVDRRVKKIEQKNLNKIVSKEIESSSSMKLLTSRQTIYRTLHR